MAVAAVTFGVGELYSLSCALAWAIAVILFKKSGESLAPFALNLFKNLLALVLLGITILLLQGPALPSMPWPALLLILLSGVLGIAQGDTLYFHALNAIGASRMAVAQTLYSPFVIILSVLFLGEHLHPLQVAGVALVLSGITLVTYVRVRNSTSARALRRGVTHAALSVLLMAIGIVIAKPMLERYDFLWVVELRIAGGLIGMGIEILLLRRAAALAAAYRGVRHWPQIVAGAIMGSYVSMILWLAGYKYTQAYIAAVLNEMAAVFILILAVLFLRERVGKRQLSGILLAVAGVILVVSKA
ncbi:MAG: DMT family transporter [Stenotrophobium sp.]